MRLELELAQELELALGLARGREQALELAPGLGLVPEQALEPELVQRKRPAGWRLVIVPVELIIISFSLEFSSFS